ncbi:DUF6671 family protein [Tellurirhabdus rosea]|uniref:DUF6671 family protein n=1 Tax=Tellurirhabdus rosea TaxID=2674997 RepID=UPI00224E4F12|nr:DUF6671 family protein [Tellurirhabdus rosea]
MDRDNEADSGPDLFRGRTVVIATMHGKEAVIASALEQALGVRCQLPEGLNTDEFGTFTGETKRPGTALEAARLKLRKALALTGESVGVASEGSFGPHPYFPFVAADLELLVFADLRNNLEITAEHISTQTNFASLTTASLDEVLRFAEAARFPSHGLILKGEGFPTVKGLHDPGELRARAAAFLQKRPDITVETDMRALHNPTRMQVIAECTTKLIEKLESRCPACRCPGFDRVERIPGLPCGHCGLPTRGIRSELYRCVRCGFGQEKVHPGGEPCADPMYCDFCNP